VEYTDSGVRQIPAPLWEPQNHCSRGVHNQATAWGGRERRPALASPTEHSLVIYIPAYAKLNLALAVVGRRPDGRHDLRSVVVRLDWHDLVGARWEVGAGTSDGVLSGPAGTPEVMSPVWLEVTGQAAGEAPSGADNLMHRAARVLMQQRPRGPVRLHLEKVLPAAAGLGGGSADAAAVIRLLSAPGLPAMPPGGAGVRSPDRPSAGDDRRPLTEAELIRLADSVGSDVPACLAGGGLLVGGAGERLEPLTHRVLHIAVAVAGRSSTSVTFATLSPGEWRGPGRPEELARRLAAGETPPDELCGSDLEEAACRANPELDARLRHLRAGAGPTRWHLTGSGGGCFALAASPAEAGALAKAAQRLGYPARACRTVVA